MAYDWTFDGSESVLDDLIEEKIIDLLDKEEEAEINGVTLDYFDSYFGSDDDNDNDDDDYF